MTPPFASGRRAFLISLAASTALTTLGLSAEAIAAEGLALGPPIDFSFDDLIAEAQHLALRPYQPVPNPDHDLVEQIDWAAHGQIRFKPQDALFAEGPGNFPIAFFYPGRFFQTPVRMFVLDQNQHRTTARELAFDKRLFDIPTNSPGQQLGSHAGFAGFRVQESRLGDQSRLDWRTNDWAAFLGASYFRAIGDQYQYGLSARGIAVNVAYPGTTEEFPHFTRFYFVPSEAHSATVVVYALLDGPSLAGAYRFAMTRGTGVVMEVESTLFLRQDIAQFGIAPITSMYWFSKTLKDTGVDWRPEVHDSDGLALWTGNGEHLWRPLNDPRQVIASAFFDDGPRGFGLMQRERRFDAYLDGVHYERRPSLWVEPLDNWGEGSVQLVEIPTKEEIYDNIVAMWVPRAQATAGSHYYLHYRLHWLSDEPFVATLARCVATRMGRGGQPGLTRPPNMEKFVVEFKGGPLEQLPLGAAPEAVLTTSRGQFSGVFTEAVPNGQAGHWRAQFDLSVEGDDPVEMRLFLRRDGLALTETWVYQYHPRPHPSGV